MNDQRRIIPAELKTYYHPTRYRYVTAYVRNAGAKPITVGPDPDAALRPERFPDADTPIADQIAEVLQTEQPLTVREIVARTGRSESAVGKALKKDTRFAIVDHVRVHNSGKTGVTTAALWGFATGDDAGPQRLPRPTMAQRSETAEAIVALLTSADGPLPVREIAAHIGKTKEQVSRVLSRGKQFEIAYWRRRGSINYAYWIVKNQEEDADAN